MGTPWDAPVGNTRETTLSLLSRQLLSLFTSDLGIHESFFLFFPHCFYHALDEYIKCLQKALEFPHKVT